MRHLLILSGLLAGSALAQFSSPEDRLAASLRLPAGSYEAAQRVEALDLALWPGSLRLKDPAVIGREQQVFTFETGPAHYGFKCHSPQVYHAPAVFSDFKALRDRLFQMSGVVGLGEDGRNFIFRRAATFGWMRWQSLGLQLNVCQVTAEQVPAATFSPLSSVYRGTQPALPVSSATGLLTWCTPAGAAWQRQLALGALAGPVVSWDGRLLAVAGFDPYPVLFLVNPENGETLHRIMRPESISSLSFSGDNQTLLSQDFSGTYTVFNTQSGKVQREWQNQSWGGLEVVGGGASSFMQVGSRHQPLRVIDAATGKVTRTLFSMDVLANTLTSDGLWAVTLDQSGHLRAYRSRDASAATARAADHTGTLERALDTKDNLVVLRPGRRPDSVLILLQTPRLSRVHVLEWRVGEATATPVQTLTADEQLALNRETGLLSAVPACLRQ